MSTSHLSRRELLRLAAGAVVLSGCGVAGAQSSASVRRFGDARLAAILRSSFIDELSDTISRQSDEWESRVDATIDLRFTDRSAERSATVARQRRGEDIAELSGNAPHEHGDRLVDVGAIADEVGRDAGGWFAAAEELCVVDGVWRAVPWASGRSLLNYRPSLLAEVGASVPSTYDEVLDVATRLREQRLPAAGFGISDAAPGDSTSLAYSLLWSFGGHEIDESGLRVAINSSATRAALDYWKELVAAGDPRAVVFDEGANNEAFLSGEIGMTQNGPSILWSARRDDVDLADDIGVVPLPGGPSGRHQFVNVHSLAVFEHSRNREAALDWVRAMTDPGRATERAVTSAGAHTPPLIGARTDLEIISGDTDASSEAVGASVEQHRPGWPGPAGREAELVVRNGTIVKMFNSVGEGRATIDGAVRTAEHELARVYET